MPQLAKDFIQQMQSQLGAEWPDFEKALHTSPPVSIHFNKQKKGDHQAFDGKPVPWCEEGRYLKNRPVFTLDPHFHCGRYYVQEAGSMFLAHVLSAILKENTINFALDLCGAPGGKTTQLLNQLPEATIVVANEVIKSRYAILRENLAKWGRSNIICTQADSKQLKGLGPLFDLILVDAPCSGEGLFRKTPEAAQEWSLENVQLCEARQKRILANTLPLLAPGAFLIYSTCTYNRKENDQSIQWLLEQEEFEVFEIETPSDWGIKATEFGLQFYPHLTQSEGFFISILRKKEGKSKKGKNYKLKYFEKTGKKEKALLKPWIKDFNNFELLSQPKGGLNLIPQKSLPLLEEMSQYLNRIDPGTPVGLIKGKDLVPAHELALSTNISKELNSLAVNEEQALQFLRKAELKLSLKVNPGWYLLRYQNFGLGWIKVLPNRINNYFPKHLRVRI